MIAQKTIKLIAFIALFMSVSSTANAQTKTREIGVKISSLNSFGLLYKIQRTENKFLRLSADFNLGSAFAPAGESFYTNAAFNIGFERRAAITDKFQFLHGFMPGVGLRYSTTNVSNVINHRLGGSVNLGYILGFQYNFAKTFFVGIETVPTLGISTNNVLNPATVNIGARFNPNVGITFVYQFEK